MRESLWYLGERGRGCVVDGWAMKAMNGETSGQQRVSGGSRRGGREGGWWVGGWEGGP